MLSERDLLQQGIDPGEFGGARLFGGVSSRANDYDELVGYLGVDTDDLVDALGLGANKITNALDRDDLLTGGQSSGLGSSLFEEFSITPGKNLNLDIPSAPGGRSYITYVFKDANDNVVYVGRASGSGNPATVLNDRIRKGHKHFRPGLRAEVVGVQKSKLASQGAEEFFLEGYREQGNQLTNIDQPLSFDRPQRIQRSLDKLEAFFDELL